MFNASPHLFLISTNSNWTLASLYSLPYSKPLTDLPVASYRLHVPNAVPLLFLNKFIFLQLFLLHFTFLFRLKFQITFKFPNRKFSKPKISFKGYWLIFNMATWQINIFDWVSYVQFNFEVPKKHTAEKHSYSYSTIRWEKFRG